MGNHLENDLHLHFVRSLLKGTVMCGKTSFLLNIHPGFLPVGPLICWLARLYGTNMPGTQIAHLVLNGFLWILGLLWERVKQAQKIEDKQTGSPGEQEKYFKKNPAHPRRRQQGSRFRQLEWIVFGMGRLLLVAISFKDVSKKKCFHCRTFTHVILKGSFPGGAEESVT